MFTNNAARGPRSVEKHALQLLLNETPLFLHHENFIQPLGKGGRPFGLQRPAECDLVQSNPKLGGANIVDTQNFQPFADI